MTRIWTVLILLSAERWNYLHGIRTGLPVRGDGRSIARDLDIDGRR